MEGVLDGNQRPFTGVWWVAGEDFLNPLLPEPIVVVRFLSLAHPRYQPNRSSLPFTATSSAAPGPTVRLPLFVQSAGTCSLSIGVNHQHWLGRELQVHGRVMWTLFSQMDCGLNTVVRCRMMVA